MKKVFILTSLAFLFSCVRAEKDQTTNVTLHLPAHIGSSEVNTKELNSALNPTVLSEVNCYLVGVSGPEPSLSDNLCKYASGANSFTVGFIKGGFFSATATATSPTSIQFEVPSGKDRVLRLIGFRVDTTGAAAVGFSPSEVCANFIASNSLQKYISDPFLLAEAGGLEMLAGEDKKVDLTATFNSSLQIGTCKGPDFPDNKNGPPNKFAITFQDGSGAATSLFRNGQCIGLRVQVQDKDGLRADLSSNPVIKAKIPTLSGGGVITGNFYSVGGSRNCDSAQLINSASSDVSFSYFNTTTQLPFNDMTLFFMPTGASAFPTGHVIVNDDGSNINPVMISSDSTYQYATSTTTPMSYSFYDLFNNQSALSGSSSTNPILIRAHECRQASLQFQDSVGLPTMISTNSGPYRSIVITPVGAVANDIRFYASSSDCSPGQVGSSTPTYSLSVPTNSYFGSLNFYYQVLNTGTFSIGIANGGSGNSLLSTGDLLGNTNYWKALDTTK